MDAFTVIGAIGACPWGALGGLVFLFFILALSESAQRRKLGKKLAEANQIRTWMGEIPEGRCESFPITMGEETLYLIVHIPTQNTYVCRLEEAPPRAFNQCHKAQLCDAYMVQDE